LQSTFVFAAWDVSDDESCSLHCLPVCCRTTNYFFFGVIIISDWEFSGCAKAN